MGPWKSHGCVRIVVHMDGDGGTFHHIHGDNKDTHQDSRAKFANTTLVVAAALNSYHPKRSVGQNPKKHKIKNP